MKASKIHDERAQGVVEFALIVTFLMMVFLGTVDYARFLYYDTALQSAARVGAEMAINHCTNASNCPDPNSSSTPVTDNYVLWGTYCEAQPYVGLQPSWTSCDNGTASTWAPTCASVSCTSCTNDICVYPADGSRSSGSQVTVAVGYKFHPISFLLDFVFTTQQCWTSSGGASQDDPTSNGHTLCSKAVGQVY